MVLRSISLFGSVIKTIFILNISATLYFILFDQSVTNESQKMGSASLIASKVCQRSESLLVISVNLPNGPNVRTRFCDGQSFIMKLSLLMDSVAIAIAIIIKKKY